MYYLTIGNALVRDTQACDAVHPALSTEAVT
jgi:hypothetical protein